MVFTPIQNPAVKLCTLIYHRVDILKLSQFPVPTSLGFFIGKKRGVATKIVTVDEKRATLSRAWHETRTIIGEPMTRFY